MSDDNTTDVGQDSGGRAHTGLDEGHPAGDGPRSDREVGGPSAGPDAPDAPEDAGVKGDRRAEPDFEPHE
ncbi:MAG TPA: hypothetical protein VM266_12470 [Solirubrobacteraceae bacterium]|nr:hypothetical protein [Solirubrobacteraceae bacterium]